MDKKYFILFLVCITAALSISVVGAGLFGDDVTVKDVQFERAYLNKTDKSDNFNEYNFDFAFVPNVDFMHVRSIKVHNVELTFGGKVEKFGDCNVRYEIDKDNNGDFKYNNMFLKNNYYSFKLKLADVKFNDPNSLSHIKGDIVINTTTQDNIVIGHIDNDVKVKSDKVFDVSHSSAKDQLGISS